MTIYTNPYLSVQHYLANVAANPKLNLSKEQQVTFKEVLQETTQDMAKTYTQSAALPMQNQNIWRMLGAAGLNSSSYPDLFMSGIYGMNGSNPLAAMSGSNLFNTNSYVSNFYPQQLSAIYGRLNAIQQNF